MVQKTKTKKALKRVFVLLLIFVILCLCTITTANLIVVSSTRNSMYEVDSEDLLSQVGQRDCIVILGCQVMPDKTPSIMLEDRLRTGVELFRAGVSDTIIVSGDRTGDYDEVSSMKNFLVSEGVPPEASITDFYGFSTNETVRNVSQVYNMKRVCFVTQEYHLSRTIYLGERYGVDSVGVCARGHVFRWQPYYTGREILARTKDFFLTLID